MRRNLVFTLLVASFVAPSVSAADLVVSASPDLHENSARHVRVDLTWKNAWRDERNHDAVWFVLRDAANARGAALRLSRSASSTDGARRASIAVSDDGVGAFVSVAEAFRGDAQLSVIVELAAGQEVPRELRVDALEMVYVPAGEFELGDDDPAAMAKGAFYVPGSGRRSLGPYLVRDESEISISLKPFDLYYEVDEVPQYRGDQQGPLPAAFPKGTRAFYVMKYETRQGDYARFLNAIPADWRARRVFTAGPKDEDAASWSIRDEGGVIVANAPTRPANFLSFDDSAAFLDWFGLRPLTELEFEKAARGPKQPCDLDFPWGNSTTENVKRRVTRERDLAESSAAAEAAHDAEARERLAQSYYGVFDLAGGVWERVVTIGHPKGRAFTGSHGDGELDPLTGDATNTDWPRGSQDAKTADGIGYRGGAEYFADEADLTNPFSAVAIRTYGAWNGAYRSKTYSARGCRTAPAIEVAAAAPSLEVELLANAGVWIDATDATGTKRSVLIDAFVREPYYGYGALDDAAFARLVGGGPVALALATHPHLDHLQGAVAKAFFDAHPETRFVSTPAAVAVLADAGVDSALIGSAVDPTGSERFRFAHGGAEVSAFYLSHGASPKLPKNLGLLVEVGGVTLVHLGDAEQFPANFEPHQLTDAAVDVAFVPYWYFGSEAGNAIVTERIRPRHVVAVHIKPGDEQEVRDGTKGLDYEVVVLDPASRWTMPRRR